MLAVWASLFIAAAGIPLPITLVLLAVGAFTGVGDFNPVWIALVATSGSVAGDQLGYGVGRRWGSQLLLWLQRSPYLQRLSGRAIAPAETYFARYGGWAVFLTRFLVSGLGGVTNLLAGATRYRYLRFLLADIAGEALGAIIPLESRVSGWCKLGGGRRRAQCGIAPRGGGHRLGCPVRASAEDAASLAW